MAYTAIDDPSEFFQTALWTGTSDDSTKTVTNDGNSDLQPDWLWIKARSGTYGTRDHAMYDSTRGATKRLESSATDAEATSDSNNTFNSDGFTLTANYSINGPNTNHVGWQWKINGGTTATNNAGSNGATLGSVYQVNNTMGVSIGTYTGDGSDRDIYTGLSASGRHNEPDMVWVKNRDNAEDWAVGLHYNYNPVAARHLSLNNTDGGDTVGGNSGEHQQGAANVYNRGVGLFEVTSGGAGDNDTHANGDNYVFYAFRQIQGFSKIGSFTTDGQADGPFIYTGFKPAWVMTKMLNYDGDYWWIVDNKRDTTNGNPRKNAIRANDSAAENNGLFNVHFHSNGFKCVDSGGQNIDGYKVLYMAFAQRPFVTSEGVPTTAF